MTRQPLKQERVAQSESILIPRDLPHRKLLVVPSFNNKTGILERFAAPRTDG